MPTTGICLVRHHTEQMQPPRFLWVPFPLGRPFGAPHAQKFQRRVLHAALALLERTDGPVVLDDFPEDAPLAAGDADQPAWSCPVSFPPPADERPVLVREAAAEIDQLAPWFERRSVVLGRSWLPVGPLSLDALVPGLGALAEGRDGSDVATELPLQEWVRLACEDLHAWTVEAARGQPGTPSAVQLEDWFWTGTAAGRLIGGVAMALIGHSHPLVRALARRAMVPRAHMAERMP